jgi:electron transfer flavoprotein alpha subunit
MKTLILVHTDEQGLLPKGAWEAIGAAGSLPYTVGVIGGAEAPAAQAEQSLCVDGDVFRMPRASSDLAACAALVSAVQPELVLAPQTSRFARVLPMLAARLNGCCDTHVVAYAEGEARRWFYRQRIEGGFRRDAKPWFLLLEPGAFEGAPDQGRVAAAPVPCEAPTLRSRMVEYVSPESGEQTIRPDADLLLVAGAGWTKKQKDGSIHGAEAADLILRFVRANHSSLGSSKSLVDQSGEGHSVLPFLTHLHQVGQTGSTPRHRKGLATCCHGEEPHVVGWRFINERRAINLDANCGWARGKADVLYVGDAFEVMKELNELL